MEAKTHPYKELISQLESELPLEEKLKRCLDFMREALQIENPNFRDFWEIQKRCLVLFKENLAAAERAPLWAAYVELSKEVRRIRFVLDEQSKFAQEQIQLAITALEEELNNQEAGAALVPPLEYPTASEALKEKEDLYQGLHRKVTFLGRLSLRVQELRKEVLASPMRAKPKNQLLEALSKLGDGIFPPRKEAMIQLSDLYTKDVEAFIESHFGKERTKLPFYVLKDEIRGFQALAKQLPLSPTVFKKTRTALSDCWDTVRVKEEERKKRIAEKPPAEERPQLKEMKTPKIHEATGISSRLQELLNRAQQQAEELRMLAEGARGALAGTDHDALSAQFDRLVESRKQLKTQIEEYRKTAGGSALNFEESMHYQQLIQTEREQLEELELLMIEIQERLMG